MHIHVVTNEAGEVVGTVRTDPVQTDDGEITLSAHALEKGQKIHEVEIDEEFWQQDPEDLHQKLASRLK
jgi:hypothetical protein